MRVILIDKMEVAKLSHVENIRVPLDFDFTAVTDCEMKQSKN